MKSIVGIFENRSDAERAVGGGVARQAIENSLSSGLPKDELFLHERHADAYRDEAFRRGYERGHAHYQEHVEKHRE